MQTIILVGASGAGKSSWVKTHAADAIVVSADRHFTGSDGVYRFDPKLLAEAHNTCLRQFLSACQSGVAPVVVDNTNTTIAEVAPYLRVAQALGHDVRVMLVGAESTDEWSKDQRPIAAVYAERNAHGVPQSGIERQLDSIERLLRTWPPYWPWIEHVGDDVERV